MVALHPDVGGDIEMGHPHTQKASFRKARTRKYSRGDNYDPVFGADSDNITTFDRMSARTATWETEHNSHVEEKFEKYFGYLARCEGIFCTTTLLFFEN